MSTLKKSSKKWRLLLWPIAALGAVIAVLGAQNPTNFAATHPDHPDARLRTRRYRCSQGQAREAVEAVIAGLPSYGGRWRIVATEPHEIRAEVPVLIFTDDLKVTIEAAENGVVLDVHSSARLGRSDLGENKRHLLQLLAALDAKLPGF